MIRNLEVEGRIVGDSLLYGLKSREKQLSMYIIASSISESLTREPTDDATSSVRTGNGRP